MKENLRLISAMRRNRQSRGLGNFLTDFNQATGLTLTGSNIVDPDLSVRIERSLASVIQQKLTDGSLVRSTELDWEDVQNRINSHTAIDHKDRIFLSLCHFEDFMLSLHLFEFTEHVKAIIQFDSDTVYALIENLEHGIGLDVYISEITGERRYTVDLW